MENNNNNNNSNRNEKGHDDDIVASTSGRADRSSCFPAGYRFVPTDDELITHYLAKKANNEPIPVADMHKVDLYSQSPHELAGKYTQLGDREWYFFTPRDRKYPKGERPSRSVGKRGYWKATGVKKPILSKEGELIGKKTCLVFYFGKPKSGKAIKTNWIMHEYELESNPSKSHETGMKLDDCILCKIYERPERLNKKQNDHVNGRVVDDGDHQEIIEDPPAISVEEKIEDSSAIALHFPNNIDGMGQNHEQLPMMMINNNGYGESNGYVHVPINGYGDNYSHQFQIQNHHRHVRMNGYVDNYSSHQFQTQNHQHVTKNGYRDHSSHQLQPQNRFDQQVVPNYPAEASPPCIQNSNLGCMMPSYDQHYYFNLHEQQQQQQQAPAGWVYRPQQLGDMQNVYWGHNGNDHFQQQYPDDSSCRTKRRRLQHDYYDQGHNEIDNVEQDPDDNINSNYVAVDEVLIGANPDDQQQGDLQQQGNNNIGNDFQQHPDDSRMKRRRLQQGEFQHDYDHEGHNGNNVDHNINSNYVAVDEGLIRANPDDDQQQGDLQQGNNNIGNNFEQDTDDIISYLEGLSE